MQKLRELRDKAARLNQMSAAKGAAKREGGAPTGATSISGPRRRHPDLTTSLPELHEPQQNAPAKLQNLPQHQARLSLTARQQTKFNRRHPFTAHPTRLKHTKGMRSPTPPHRSPLRVSERRRLRRDASWSNFI